MSVQNLQGIIENAFENRANINSKTASAELRDAINQVIDALDRGEIRVAEKVNGDWVTNQWIKKAVLLSFRIEDNFLTEVPGGAFYDKVPLKFNGYTAERFAKEGIRAVPGCVVRRGAFLEKDTILLPSFVNIGAHVGSGTMVDTWATVGSCAQVGKNVHIAGGAGIGGVLEPVQAGPTIIEDNCFIGARSEVVEGVIVGEGSVISMGVFLGKSTRIYDRTTGEISYGRIPPHSVVVAGNLPSKDGKYSLYAAIIVKKVDEKTLSKVGLNDLLRQAQEEVSHM
ncbi:MAG: 2,3,4,5-tetrahydropyridine-2,6-dicarboxylate N-succinyltransferase [Succinivibrio sp.]|uniref:2,3,4,5-tetrahydropyridine-2,6-dicarboxylate N-succinyltransferase n=1 Tax=Succinivibrio faecicola TaxID=2820300 RepID=A0ABS7DES8_9GAMM|nr:MULTISPECIES: 2,3,4,5-tetrahydropyridine-2,6-dicarboxylate N-succinyltransferase [Succinivibrio]MBW7569738.1 2,3,4,5-tetrahydropyridine-2,6-dicarboxylate N-succinyltransferase [Succinivibrio faecicola]MCI6939053.1 2,3,4,5-tetrahydropyridine-2,6-dicarboxylate N-succinyltransferase [Succinatimonas hippei]MDD6205958.1 2,3,4,5-tetrahydropyridine-2,6-dicarboxylate N-succinyltransferase [Succinivibrio sp.]